MQECKNEVLSLIEQAEETAKTTAEQLKRGSLTLALAESCTAGLVSGLLANTSGASAVLWGSYVCYTKEAKVSMLDLKACELDTNGLVSRFTACSMAEKALQKSGANLAAAITGLAGPAGDGSGVPVGTIWIAVALKDGNVQAQKLYFTGGRNEVRIRAAIAVLEMILNITRT
jgi:PncC family amidohydrolase